MPSIISPPKPAAPSEASAKLGKRFGKLPLCTASELRRRVEQGEYLVIIDGLVCKLNGFINKHPGGPLSIMHMVGRDATDEARSMHPAEVFEGTMPRWAVARFVADEKAAAQASYVEDLDLPYSTPRSTLEDGSGHPQPESSSATDLDYAAIQHDYRKLDVQLREEGMYQCDYRDYAGEA
ncbi:hypothetical protein FBU31_006998, partial [Coemansia sp. 'formosensis']